MRARSHLFILSALLLTLTPLPVLGQSGDKPRLGVKLHPTTNRGVLVIDVLVGYAAHAAGLQPGDRITAVGDRPIAGVEEFRDAVAGIEEDQTIQFTIVRDGQGRQIAVKMIPPRDDAPGARPPSHPELREELLAMREKDQAARTTLMETPDLSKEEQAQLIDEMRTNDEANLARLKQIITEHDGIPTISMVGEDAAGAVFLMIQHADREPQWQASMLPKLEELARKGEASKSSVAYLTDRVLVHQGKPQRYGTQYHQKQAAAGSLVYAPQPTEDPADLDERRLSMGLGPWTDYEAQMAKMQQREPLSVPPGPEDQ